jgi:FkbM family methyltransferase
MPESTAIPVERSRLSQYCIAIAVAGLRTVGLSKPAIKLQNSLNRRALGEIVEAVAERCSAYMNSLGTVRGLVTYVRCYFPRRQGCVLIQVKAPGLRSPLIIRAAPPDVKVFEQVYVDRHHNMDEPESPRLIIDAGAHIGCVSAALAARFPESTIFAIEPDAANYTLLCRNVAPYPNVFPIRAAVWHRPEVLSISNPEAEPWAFRMRQVLPGESDGTVGITIGEFLKWTGAPEIDILKVDIEGAERELFAAPDAKKWIACVREIRLELHDRIVPGCEEAVERAIALSPAQFSRSTIGEYVVFRRTRAQAERHG